MVMTWDGSCFHIEEFRAKKSAGLLGQLGTLGTLGIASPERHRVGIPKLLTFGAKSIIERERETDVAHHPVQRCNC